MTLASKTKYGLDISIPRFSFEDGLRGTVYEPNAWKK